MDNTTLIYSSIHLCFIRVTISPAAAAVCLPTIQDKTLMVSCEWSLWEWRELGRNQWEIWGMWGVGEPIGLCVLHRQPSWTEQHLILLWFIILEFKSHTHTNSYTCRHFNVYAYTHKHMWTWKGHKSFPSKLNAVQFKGALLPWQRDSLFLSHSLCLSLLTSPITHDHSLCLSLLTSPITHDHIGS